MDVSVSNDVGGMIYSSQRIHITYNFNKYKNYLWTVYLQLAK